MRRACDHLLAEQDAAGSWTDWTLPPGSSSEWTTAHVGWRLSTAARDQPGVDAALSKASLWLHAHQHADGGWGYNPSVPSDADSTALAILFLSSASQPVSLRSVECLRSFQRGDGGFSTYRPDGLTGSWGRSHAEITPMALLALMSERSPPHDPAIKHGVAWIDGARRSDGLWEAFWWSGPLMACAANLACLAALGRSERPPQALASLCPSTPLEKAILLGILTSAGWGPQVAALTADLLGTQRPDGTWRSVPALRITRRDCDRPWDSADAGPLFGDDRRLFTTATVLFALSCARERLSRQLVPATNRWRAGARRVTVASSDGRTVIV